MIKYLGSKRRLVPAIVELVRQQGDGVTTVLDLFSGTSRVGHALKAAGYRVIANDQNAYAHTLALCYVQADAEDVVHDAERLLAELDRLPGRPGYVTETHCERARYFHPKNGARIDAIREAIAKKCLDPELEAVLLVSLMEAADRVDSTVGVQMAYLKSWAPRALRDLELRLPEVLPRARHGKGEAHRLDAREAAGLAADLVYLDPPYNQHSYLGNYHVWESLVRWDRPEVYGIACKRVDVKARRSDFNSKRRCFAALAATLDGLAAPHWILSFNDEGHLQREVLEKLLRARGALTVASHANPRYVGAKIGIHDPSGARVGEVGHLTNREYLFHLAARPRA